jgi:hypothetical protein
VTTDERTKRNVGSPRSDRVGKVFIVAGQNVRQCLVCEAVLFREAAAEHASSVVAGLQGSPTMEQTIEVMYKPKWLRDKEEALKRKIAEKLEREADLLEKKSSGE